MFCPECGKQLDRGDWRCDHCGSDLRKILREEYWNQPERPEVSESSSERFRQPEKKSTDIGWHDIRMNQRPPIKLIAGGAAGLLVLIILLYAAFKPSPPTDENPEEAGSSVAMQGGETPKPENVSNTPAPEPASTVASEPASSAAQVVELNQESAKAFIDNWLAAWRKTYETRKVDELSKFYSDSFKSDSGKNKAQFLASKQKLAGVTNFIEIAIGEPEIVIRENQAELRFDQTYFSDNLSDMGKKKLVIVKEASGLKIVNESFEDATPAPSLSSDKLQEIVLSWRKSWEDSAVNKKLGDLPNYYSANFKGPGGIGKDAWMNKKLAGAKKFELIAVDIQNIRVSALGDKAAVTFTQLFKSNTYGDEGAKTLVFAIEDGEPKIVNEVFAMGKVREPIKIEEFWGPQ